MRKIKFIYARTASGKYFRAELSAKDLQDVLVEQMYRGRPVSFIRWAEGNMDYDLGAPRVLLQEPNLLQLWYRAEVEPFEGT